MSSLSSRSLICLGLLLLAGAVAGADHRWVLNVPTAAAQLPRRGQALAAGARLITAFGTSRAVAERVATLILRGAPVAAEDSDALRKLVVAALPTGAPLTGDEKTKLSLYCGDVHLHSFYSDGCMSPPSQALGAMYNFEDFTVLTDHNTLDGILMGGKLLAQYGFACPFIMGEEITTPWTHMNAYPLQEVVSWTLSPYDTVKAAHAQGAVLHWNHPGYPDHPWQTAHTPTGLVGTGCDAWEHEPDAYDEWVRAGKVPVIVGSTDCHDWAVGCYGERTVILAPSPQGADLAEALRWRRAVAVIPSARHLLYGPPEMVATLAQALAEGTALKTQKAERIRATLAQADLAGLTAATPIRRIGKQAGVL